MSIVKSLSVGNGDMFYIKHDTDSFTIIDCCMSEESMNDIIDEMKSNSSGRGVIRFISTHPDNDHIKGLAYLNRRMPIANFYCVKNKATKEPETDDFKAYCALRDSKKAFDLHKDCSRRWLNKGNEERGSSGIRILWPNRDNRDFKDELESVKKGNNLNNIAPIIQYSLENSAKILWMGDLKRDFVEKIADAVEIGPADVLFAPHHGRDTGYVPIEWLKSMDPRMVIIGEAPSEYLNYYDGVDTITQNSAGDITLECIPGKIHAYVSESNYSVDFLDDENLPDDHGKYIGTLMV